MNLKRYSLFKMILIVIVGFVIYSTNGDEFTFRWGDGELTLPLALWVPIFMAVFYIFSAAYIWVVNMGSYFEKRQEAKDAKAIISQIKALMLGEKIGISINSNLLKNISSALACASKIDYDKAAPKPQIAEIDAAIDALVRLEIGDNIDVKALKIRESNPLYIKNELNRLNKEPRYSIELLKKSDLQGELKERALASFIELGDLKEFRKLSRNIPFDKNSAKLFVNAYCERKIDVSGDELVATITKSGFDRSDYISIHAKLKNRLSPDELISFFEKLANADENAEEGLIYTLLDLEMIEKAKERVANSNHEYQKLEAFFALKECGKNYPFTLFFTDVTHK